MNSRHPEHDLPDFVRGRIPAAMRERIEAHLRSCERCTNRVKELQNFFKTLAGIPQADHSILSPSFLVELNQRIDSIDHRTESHWRPTLAIPSIVTVIFAFVVLFDSLRIPPATTTDFQTQLGMIVRSMDSADVEHTRRSYLNDVVQGSTSLSYGEIPDAFDRHVSQELFGSLSYHQALAVSMEYLTQSDIYDLFPVETISKLVDNTVRRQ